MRRILRARLLASALALSVIPSVMAVTPAQAQVDVGISFDSFHDQLAPYGDWLYSDRWGTVWRPADVSDDFRPYYGDGHWVYTDDYGWMWVSDEPWGDVPFHYGRWVDDPDDGWLWIPGYTWGPGWVVWRSNGNYIGWMPMPPDDAFLEGGGDAGDVSVGASISFGWGGDPYFGYRRWYGNDYDDRRFASNWVFVGMRNMGDRDYRRDAIRDPARVVTIIHQTQNVTNYTVVNNYVVDKSVDVHAVERATGHAIRGVQARSVIRRPALFTTVNAGQRVRMRERVSMRPGTGMADSAPPPPQRVVEKLSTQMRAWNGRQPTHLFTKTTVANPEVMSRFHGTPNPHGQVPNATPNNPPRIENRRGPAPENLMERGQGSPNTSRPLRQTPPPEAPLGGERSRQPTVAPNPSRMDNRPTPENHPAPENRMERSAPGTMSGPSRREVPPPEAPPNEMRREQGPRPGMEREKPPQTSVRPEPHPVEHAPPEKGRRDEHKPPPDQPH